MTDKDMDHWIMKNDGSTVDGRNPAPADMVNIPWYTGFLYIPGGAGLFLHSMIAI